MVLLAHILNAGLSNSLSELVIFQEDSRFTGIAKLLWANSVKEITKKSQAIVLITDISSLRFIDYLDLPVQEASDPISSSCIINLIPNINKKFKIDPEIFSNDSIICIDNLEQAGHWIGEPSLLKTIDKRIKLRKSIYAVVNTNYLDKKLDSSYLSKSAILVQVKKYSRGSGVCECFHSRSNFKFTKETCGFTLSGAHVTPKRIAESASKAAAPKTTFRLDTSEEEKKMREITPLPYERKDRLITVEPEDYIESDEEGDEDETF
ncbi:unnamed protein product [Blepharisma stoltei]|uniref:Elongator complex protein 5 n=1 Tax=Blepharisma stoltei TaxID=1481888 RepID=A0AAU9K8Y2_9CILI|nr:unnamed protein product [Blepharisma stoltei]